MIVDYALTIAISVAAASSAIIAFQPGLAPARIPLAVVLLTAVAGLTLFGHHGRSLFALMTISFVVIGSIVIVIGLIDPAGSGGVAAYSGRVRSVASARGAARVSRRDGTCHGGGGAVLGGRSAGSA